MTSLPAPLRTAINACSDFGEGYLSPVHVEELLRMQTEREVLDNEIHQLHMTYLSLQSECDTNEQLLRQSKYSAEHLAEQCREIVIQLEDQLTGLSEERHVASNVLLKCSRELFYSQAIVAHKVIA